MWKIAKAFLIGGGALWAATAIWHNAAELHRESRWATVDGRIIEAGIEPSPARRVNWVPRVRYEYIVEGRRHSSERIGVSGPSAHGEYTEQKMRETLIKNGWQPGAIVTVYYDPDNESNSALDVRSGYVGLLFSCVAFAALGVFCVVYGIRALTAGGDNKKPT